MLVHPIDLFLIENDVKNEFNNWDNIEYIEWECANKSEECEKYFESKGYNCLLIYGHQLDENGLKCCYHRWNLVKINNEYIEFESTSLEFFETSKQYIIHRIENGYVVNGITYPYSQPLDGWEDMDLI